MIYFMQPVGGGPVKIGHSADVTTRHKQLEAHYGCELAILATMEGDLNTEAAVHARFAHLRLSNGKPGRQPEQFYPAVELSEFIGAPLLVSADPDAVEVMAASADSKRKSIVVVKGSAAWADWYRRLVKHSRMPGPALIDIALKEWGERNGFTEAPPER